MNWGAVFCVALLVFFVQMVACNIWFGTSSNKPLKEMIAERRARKRKQ